MTKLAKGDHNSGMPGLYALEFADELTSLSGRGMNSVTHL